jgi:hypothetical protein
MTFRSTGKFTLLLLVACIALPVAAAHAADNVAAKASYSGKIDYWFVGHLDQRDADGRLLVWEARVEGDFTGTMKWWVVTPPPVGGGAYSGGRLGYYAARWEVWNGDTLMLAGESAGKTVFAEGADGIWDGHGVVTEAGADYASLVGRKVYETGTVIRGEEPPATFTGTGLFFVY